jgi:ribosomal protein S12 methylthiotransferase accessory factor
MADGGHRVTSPEETFKRFEHHISPITGAVGQLQRYEPSDGVLHVYVGGVNLGAPRSSLSDLQISLRSRAAGKGITDQQAKASCLCESLERYSGVFRGTEPRRTTTLGSLEGFGIHPNDCMRFSARQYQLRRRINAEKIPGQHVPAPFDEEMEIEWTPVWSFTRRLYRYVPTAFCYYGYPSPPIETFCIACSNGNAAGNTLEEAILQGFLELVERDSTAIWWYNRLQRPAVDMDSFDDPYVGQLQAFLKARGREVWALDLSNDLGIPVCAAISRRTDRAPEHILMGLGAHLDPRIALLRALTELNQSLTWVLPTETSKQGTQGTGPIEGSHLANWLRTATIADQRYLTPDARQPRRAAQSYDVMTTDDLRDDLLFCQELIERRGLELLVLDQTRPDIGLPVVKVIVPGLRHFWPRFAPGRLYDIPVSLGWRTSPIAEEELNPIPVFF